MLEPDKSSGPPLEPSPPFEPAPPIELGGPIQDQALGDHGRLVIQRVGILLEGSTPAVVTGVCVSGAVAAAAIGQRPGGLLPGIVAMIVILAMHFTYFRRST